MKKLSLVLALVISVLFAQTAAANTNLVTNGSFETGDFTGWVTPSPLPATLGVASGIGYLSNNAAYFGAVSFDTRDTISQDLATTPGQWYNVSFYLANNFNPSPDGTFWASFGGILFAAVPSVNAFDYTRYSGYMQASTPVTTLAFTAYQHNGYFYLDDVSASAVPIPGSLLLLASGLLPLGWRRLRKG